MDNLNKVYNLLVDSNIFLENFRLKNQKAAAMKIDNAFGIFVDYNQIDSLYEEFITVAHEAGHCMTGATHKVSSPMDLVSRHEYRANKWAVHNFLPFENILKAAKAGYESISEMSDFLDLPPEFVHMALDIYRNEGKL